MRELISKVETKRPTISYLKEARLDLDRLESIKLKEIELSRILKKKRVTEGLQDEVKT